MLARLGQNVEFQNEDLERIFTTPCLSEAVKERIQHFLPNVDEREVVFTQRGRHRGCLRKVRG